jgi:transposase
LAPLDSTSFHVEGRSNSAEEPAEHVLHIPRGSSRDQRPDLKHVMLALIGAHHAGMPVLMTPLSGNRSDVQDVGRLSADPVAQVQRTSGPTLLGADSALSSAEHLQKRAAPRTPWSTRVPATWRAAQAGLAHAAPLTLAPLAEG